ncbi:hypothetical protein O181_034559 [Austropuccinia psidii MF-1]|uniref:Uncharacterized protein n=1 Tax=Austropuccinia psidii MF-1 TaxID=1389203 RepID=A0A9Q3H9N4_9BASI|nr:hypothetical protein [Austropuccinia psidii MF-1]
MPSTRSGASYKPSSRSQKCHRCDSGRSQLVTEGQGSVDEAQTDKLCHSDADNTVSSSNRAETGTRILSGHLCLQPDQEKAITPQEAPKKGST